MISQRALNYAKILYSMKLPAVTINESKDLLLEHNELMDILESPVVKKQERDAVIDRLFQNEISSFVKVLCENEAVGLFAQISEAYDELEREQMNTLRARLIYVKKPGEEELSQIKNMLCDKYKKSEVYLELEEDASLIGGYILSVGDTVFDKSIKGALSEMQKALNRR
jgi:F-type H+-transporting ATPase subunit delta